MRFIFPILTILAIPPSLSGQAPIPWLVDSITAQPEPTELQYNIAIDSLKNIEPRSAAAAAWNSGDKRLQELGGFRPVLPGVPGDRYRDAYERFGVRVFRWTSDYFEGGASDRWHRAAFEFAKQYNQAILQKADSQ
jgi:hypothetical protein